MGPAAKRKSPNVCLAPYMNHTPNPLPPLLFFVKIYVFSLPFLKMIIIFGIVAIDWLIDSSYDYTLSTCIAQRVTKSQKTGLRTLVASFLIFLIKGTEKKRKITA